MLLRLSASITFIATLMMTPLQAQPMPDKSIYICSLPRAIDFYLQMGLVNFYQLNTFLVSNKAFPSDSIISEAFNRFAANSTYINSDYVPPSPANIALLTKGLGKMILLVREPRDALISWMDYTEQQVNHQQMLSLVYPPPPTGYYSWTYEQKADWQIAHYYTYAMSWLNEWANFLSANPQLQVLNISFEQMATQPLQVFQEIVSFYGTESALFTEDYIMPMTFDQFRATPSEIGQWKTMLTPAQQQTVTSMLNAKTAKFFNWTE